MLTLLDVVVGQGAAILELLASEDESLLVRRDALLVLDLRLDVVDRVGRLHLKGDCLACARTKARPLLVRAVPVARREQAKRGRGGTHQSRS